MHFTNILSHFQLLAEIGGTKERLLALESHLVDFDARIPWAGGGKTLRNTIYSFYPVSSTDGTKMRRHPMAEPTSSTR